MLVESGIRLIKFWLDISKTEQAKRLEERRTDPLKRLKAEPMDEHAQKRWDDYTKARDEMLLRTHTAFAPWICVRADHKKARAAERHAPPAAHPGLPAAPPRVEAPDPEVLFPFEAEALDDGRLAR